jgi:ATP-dependent exoDNAse (exonuclease V) beta subunit
VNDPLADRFIRYWPWPFGKQQKVPVADDIALTPMAASFRESAVEESKRLLYVGTTRARDFLVLARSSRKPTGEWIDCVKAPWLLSEVGCESITLPSGEKVCAEHWILDPVEEPEAILATKAGALHWFRPADTEPLRQPLIFNPSLANERPATVVEKCKIGKRISVASGSDMRLLGTAIHDCLTLSFADRTVPLTETEVERILAGYEVTEFLSSEAVLQQVHAFHSWLEERWPGAKPNAEIAVQSLLESGQVLNGRIDLLLETTAGWILIDHKSSQLAPEHWDQLATEYGAQIDAYGNSVEQASHKKVLENWIFLPVAGGALSVVVI